LPNTHHRHPELVSGSIVPPARRGRDKCNGAVQLVLNAPMLAEKWILKQVQDDDLGKGSRIAVS
jgi:hypothetical protein